jgi:hypothetical protein
MKMRALFFLSLVSIFGLSPTALQAGAVIREQGAIYLEDFMEKPVRLATLAQAPIFYHSDMARYLGTLRKGQLVELQAVGENAYRIRGQAQQGQVAGWVDPKYLAPLKKEFLAALKQNADRLAEVNALIARNEVAINMTPQEVTASLGKPAKTTSRLDAKGREEVWEFVKFERVPQSVTAYDNAGRLVTRTVYVKVPVGKLAISFENNLVSSLEQTEGTFARDARVKIVAAPFMVTY